MSSCCGACGGQDPDTETVEEQEAVQKSAQQTVQKKTEDDE